MKAVAQVTKQGFTYVLDRITGEPVWPIEERPVHPPTCRRASSTDPALSNTPGAIRATGYHDR